MATGISAETGKGRRNSSKGRRQVSRRGEVPMAAPGAAAFQAESLTRRGRVLVSVGWFRVGGRVRRIAMGTDERRRTYRPWEEDRGTGPGGCGRSGFCDLCRASERRIVPVMRQHHAAGDEVLVGCSGKRAPIVDLATGVVREAEIVVAGLGASCLTMPRRRGPRRCQTGSAPHAHCRPARRDATQARSNGRTGPEIAVHPLDADGEDALTLAARTEIRP